MEIDEAVKKGQFVSRKIVLYDGNPGVNRHWASWQKQHILLRAGVFYMGDNETNYLFQFSLKGAKVRQHYYSKTTCVALECRSLASDSEYEILIQFDSKLICDDWLKSIELQINLSHQEDLISTDQALHALSEFVKERLYLQSRNGDVQHLTEQSTMYSSLLNNKTSESKGTRQIAFDQSMGVVTQIWKSEDYSQIYAQALSELKQEVSNINVSIQDACTPLNQRGASLERDIASIDDFVIVEDDFDSEDINIASSPSQQASTPAVVIPYTNNSSTSSLSSSKSGLSALSSYLTGLYSSVTPITSSTKAKNKHHQPAGNDMKSRSTSADASSSTKISTMKDAKYSSSLPRGSSSNPRLKKGSSFSSHPTYHSNVMIKVASNNLQPSDTNQRGDLGWGIPVPRMRVLIMAVGTRGDVQPFALLGKRLVADGHRVRLATHACFRDYVESAGEGKLEFYPLAGDPVKLSQFMVKTHGCIIPTSPDMMKAVPENLSMLHDIIESCWCACTDPDPMDNVGGDSQPRKFIADAIISNPVTYAHIHCAEALGVPLHMMFPQPWVATKAFPHPLACLSYSSGWSAENYLSYQLVDRMMWISLEPFINKFRVQRLGLPPIRLGEQGWNIVNDNKVPFVHMWSQHLVPKPKDWSSHIDVVGFFLEPPNAESKSSQTTQFTPPRDLAQFLSEEESSPPIFVGFGSMVIDNPVELVEILLEAAALAGVRILVQTGWSDICNDEFVKMCNRVECKVSTIPPTLSMSLLHDEKLRANQIFDNLLRDEMLKEYSSPVSNPWSNDQQDIFPMVNEKSLSPKLFDPGNLENMEDDAESPFFLSSVTGGTTLNASNTSTALSENMQKDPTSGKKRWTSKNAMIIGPCPHDWLFPKMRAVVHHGGAGTTAAGLQAGKPTMICPFFGDQYFWGEMVFRSGVGPPPCPVTQLTVEKATQAFSFLKRKETIESAEKMSKAFNAEDGVDGALNAFYRNLKLENMLCDVSIFFGESRLAQVWCNECGFKMTREVSDYIHESGACDGMTDVPMTLHTIQPCTYLNWGVKGPSSMADGLIQGLGGATHEVAGGLVDAVSAPMKALYNDGLKGAVGGVMSGLKHLVVRPMNGGMILYHKVSEGMKSDGHPSAGSKFTRDGVLFRPEDSGIYNNNSMDESVVLSVDDLFEPYSSDSSIDPHETPEDVKDLAKLMTSQVMSTSFWSADGEMSENKLLHGALDGSLWNDNLSQSRYKVRDAFTTQSAAIKGGKDALLARSFLGDYPVLQLCENHSMSTSRIYNPNLDDDDDAPPLQHVVVVASPGVNNLGSDRLSSLSISADSRSNSSVEKQPLSNQALPKERTAYAYTAYTAAAEGRPSKVTTLASRSHEIMTGYKEARRMQSAVREIVGNESRFISLEDFTKILNHAFGDYVDTPSKNLMHELSARLVEIISRKKTFVDFVDFSLLIQSLQGRIQWKHETAFRVISSEHIS